MTDGLPGRPIRNGASRRAENLHIYFLLILGIAFIGAGTSIMGFAVASLAAVGVGAGAEVAAGLVSIFLFLRFIASPALQTAHRGNAAN
jgi:hypothetical protein